jgi:succinoglycan biosynthesis transport protein ExoP
MNAAQDPIHSLDPLIAGLRNVYAHKFALIFLCTAAAAAAYYGANFLPKKYASTLTLAIEGELEGSSRWDSAAPRVTAFDKSFLNTQYELLVSRDLAEDIAATHDSIDCDAPLPDGEESRGSRVREIMRNVTVEPVRNTTLFRITALCHTPQAAKRVAEMYAQAFIQFKQGDFQAEKTRASAWVEEQMVTLRENLLMAEKKLQEFKEEAAIFSSGGDGSVSSMEMDSLLSAYSAEQEKLAQLRAVNQQIADLGEDYEFERLASIPRVRDDRIVVDLVGKLSVVAADYAELRDRYHDAYPGLQDARTRYNELMRQLRAQVTSVAEGVAREMKASQGNLASIKADLDRAKNNVITEGRKRAQLAQLEQNVEVNRDLYLAFLKKAGDISHAKSFVDNKIRIVNKAYEPSAPAGPSQMMWGGVGFGGAFFALSGIWFVLGAAGRGQKVPVRTETKLDTTLLGLLPHVQTAGGEVAYDGFIAGNNSSFSEGIRSIRTSLKLLRPSSKGVVTVITSTSDTEGRSTVALNLAAAFGKTEGTLLIDTDMRHPVLSRMHGAMETTPGLLDVLTGASELEDYIMSGLREYYDFLPVGRLAAKLSHTNIQSPLELLASEQFMLLMERLLKYYQRIIIDSSPISSFRDAKVIARSRAEVVYVVAPPTDRNMVKRSLEELQAANADVAGVVLNKVDPGELRHYGYSAYETEYAKLIGHGKGSATA